MAAPPAEHILLVENDPQIADLIARQALQAAGYHVSVVTEAGEALKRVLNDLPDVVIADLNLPGLNGRDLMVALTSQKVAIPVVVLANQASEGDILQAYRLGAADTILWPVREAEVITVVERVISQVRERKEREQLSQKLKHTNLELQQRVRELTTLFSIGKVVTSISDPDTLFEKVLDGAIYITKADLGWFLLKPEGGKELILAAQHGLPDSVSALVGQEWNDGISPLVATSGEPLSIHSDLLNRFKAASFGQSILVVPVKIFQEVAALVVVMRKAPIPFSGGDRTLLEAIADYAAMSLANTSPVHPHNPAPGFSPAAGLSSLNEKISENLIDQGRFEIFPALEIAENAVQRLMRELLPRWTTEQRQMLADVQRQLLKLRKISSAMYSIAPTDSKGELVDFNLAELINQRSLSYQHYAQQNLIRLNVDTSAGEFLVHADPAHIGHALSGLLCHAIRSCNPNGKIELTLSDSKADGSAEVSLEYSGELTPEESEQLFLETPAPGTRSERFVGLGISLPLVKEIITAYRGRIRVAQDHQESVKIIINLPKKTK